MEQTIRQIETIKNGSYLRGLRNARRFEPEVYDLVEADLDYGLTEKQTDLYLVKGFSLDQMKMLSGFLRNGIDEEFVKKLTAHEQLSVYQMQVALEFYQKGVPEDVIEKTIMEDNTPVAMRKIFESILANTENVKKKSENVSEKLQEYVKGLVAQIEEVVGKIQYQDTRYDELNKKLKVFENTKKDEEVRDGLVEKLADTEAELSSQQDKLNSATSTIARLREQISQKEKEMVRMQNRIDTLEDRLLEKADILAKQSETKETLSQEAMTESDGRKAVESDSSIMADTKAAVMENMTKDDPFARNAYGIPVYYQMPVVDAQGRVLQRVPVEHTRRTSDRGIAAIIGKLCFKKKSRQDIVKLVASGDLVPAQLVQIKSGMEKGLTEEQLVELINNNVSAEKMKEIIEIAVLENSMDY